MSVWQQILAGVFGRYRPTPPPPPKPPYVWPARPAEPGGNLGIMLDLVNEYRSQTLNRMPKLEPDAALTAWAMSWAEQMWRAERVSHAPVAAIGSGLIALGYRWYTWSENVAGPWTDGTPTTAKEVLELWANSPPHRANMLDYAMTDVGIGYAEGYWCATFGRKA